MGKGRERARERGGRVGRGERKREIVLLNVQIAQDHNLAVKNLFIKYEI